MSIGNVTITSFWTSLTPRTTWSCTVACWLMRGNALWTELQQTGQVTEVFCCSIPDEAFLQWALILTAMTLGHLTQIHPELMQKEVIKNAANMNSTVCNLNPKASSQYNEPQWKRGDCESPNKWYLLPHKRARCRETCSLLCKTPPVCPQRSFEWFYVSCFDNRHKPCIDLHVVWRGHA